MLDEKNKKIILLAVLLATASGILIPVGQSISDNHLLSKSEHEMQADGFKMRSEKLIRVINRLEKHLPTMEEKTKLVLLINMIE